VAGEKEQLRRSWDANAEAWCSAVRDDLIESRRTVTNAAIIAAVLEEKPGRVLDIGCGEGWLARRLSAAGATVTGFDASAPLIEAANRAGGGSFLALTYDDVAANPRSLGGPFDTMVANFSLLDDRAGDLLRSLRTVLAAEGRLIVQTTHPLAVAGEAYVDGWRTETFAGFPGEWPEAMPWYFRTVSSWWRLLLEAGFTVISLREPMYESRPMPASLLLLAG